MAGSVDDVLKMTGRNPETVEFGPFRFIPGDGLRRDGRPVPLPPRALAVLTVLLASPDRVVSKQTLMNAVWPDTFVTESSLLEAIGLLRDVLGDDRKQPIYIQTVHRRGYRFIGEITGAEASAEAVALQTPRTPEAQDRREALRPILLACVSYAVTTVCVAIVFAVFGHDRREPVAALASNAPPQFAISHRGELVYLSASGAEVVPAWTPSGLEIAFAFSKAGPFNLLMTLPADVTPLLAGPGRQFPTSWSADHGQLAFTEHQPMTGADIWVMDLRTGLRRPLARTWFDETWARFSPDGRWIAYMSNESGRWDVYVRSADGEGQRIRVSPEGGVWPSWSNDSRTIFFNAAVATMASAISAVPVLAAADPVIVRQDGGRAAGRAELRVVLEWFAELTDVNHRGHRQHRDHY
jgi:DNA-binding winged helix-turn-helix (wHTH) protein